jgi:hypothetical protein
MLSSAGSPPPAKCVPHAPPRCRVQGKNRPRSTVAPGKRPPSNPDHPIRVAPSNHQTLAHARTGHLPKPPAPPREDPQAPVPDTCHAPAPRASARVPTPIDPHAPPRARSRAPTGPYTPPCVHAPMRPHRRTGASGSEHMRPPPPKPMRPHPQASRGARARAEAGSRPPPPYRLKPSAGSSSSRESHRSRASRYRECWPR